ncbi:hypothetical protein E2C01_079477 [Portunus trituberculatus]|uniref:Uncharacterized protein n=1 Tax=Portunus trituberculatus TaxID=210409 RepID=A0A5B7IRI5_PORTR|nr:hypothetical protein [Portunus trituberculatus]
MYVRSGYRIKPAQRLMLERCCGQTQANCVLHSQLLIRQAQGIHLIYSVPTCTCVLFWCCPNNFGDTKQCTVGLCKKHFKLAVHDLPHETFTVGNYGPTLPTPSVPTARKQRHIQDNHNDPSDEDDTDYDYDQIVTFALDCHPPVDEETDEQPQDLYPIGNTNQMENACPLATSTDIVPLFMTENSSTKSGHFYLNHHLRVMARTSFSQKPPVATLQLLQNICSKSPNWNMPLIYPEAMLFPRILLCQITLC